MKQLLLSFSLLLVLFACKKDSPTPEPEIKDIVGKWKVTAHEQKVNGTNSWVPVNGAPYYLVIRNDGLILDLNGCPNCAPKSYYVNGVLFEAKQKEPVSSQCPIVDCIGCATWDIDQTGDELIVTLCDPTGTRTKYIRE
ncbi:hypothetical protein [Dyadobacter sandarakinus]|uniref:Lipocalin-like domain-containing protein n=1 Tax=Dyadobacter sandarakinus TaxID=2747268 RepID=A0ABX7I6H5_9BACT|nr:hypothetical protein [Dyadobacter sandarakinus]QRR01390.1 hypothetical protein HWI92_10995 [Dyadobacter sandarakinus]